MSYPQSKWNSCKCLSSNYECYVRLVSNFGAFDRYEEAREEEKLRGQREDFSDMVAEVCHLPVYQIKDMIFVFLIKLDNDLIGVAG